MRGFPLPLAAVLSFWLPLTAHAEDSVDRAAIDEANARLIALQKQGNAEGMGDMYTDDAILLPSGAERADGREAIQAFWAKNLGSGVEEVELKTETLESLGDDLVYEIGSYKTTPKDAEPVTGYYLVLWKRVDGRWKLHVDIFNENGGQ
ncbi:MAG TPA: SgcJ/EcaC family oxidoreductase [Woeseiaceae bacterium]|nr:SgcJ/EcaC family oxidoreductase [Woeseiaceae bacterium]